MMPHQKREAHSTTQEITFPQDMIKNKHTPRQRTPSQLKMTLQNYIATIDKRRWDAGVDVAAVKRYATELLT